MAEQVEWSHELDELKLLINGCNVLELCDGKSTHKSYVESMGLKHFPAKISGRTSFDSLNKNEIFDAVFCIKSLAKVSGKKLQKLLLKTNELIRENGVFMTVIEDLFTQQSDFADLLISAGFTPLQSYRREHEGKNYLVFFARKQDV